MNDRNHESQIKSADVMKRLDRVLSQKRHSYYLTTDYLMQFNNRFDMTGAQL